MTSSIFESYAKAYEVALFGRGKNDRAHHEAHNSAGQAPALPGRLQRSAGRTLRGLIGSRRA